MLAPKLQKTCDDGEDDGIDQKGICETEVIDHAAAKGKQAGIEKAEFTDGQHHCTEAQIRNKQQIVDQIAVGKNHCENFIDQKADNDKDDMRHAYSSPFSPMMLTTEKV